PGDSLLSDRCRARGQVVSRRNTRKAGHAAHARPFNNECLPCYCSGRCYAHSPTATAPARTAAVRITSTFQLPTACAAAAAAALTVRHASTCPLLHGGGLRCVGASRLRPDAGFGASAHTGAVTAATDAMRASSWPAVVAAPRRTGR